MQTLTAKPYRLNLLLTVFGLLLLLSSCALFKSETTKGPEEKLDKTKADTTQEKTKAEKQAEQKRLDSLAKAQKRKDSLNQLYPIEKPDTFQVALILPLFTEIQTDTFSLSKRNKAIANVASSFYTGARMAFDSLRNCGQNIKLKVYDSKNDSIRMLTIREKLKADTPDLILGPLFTQNVRLLSGFAKRSGTNLVSPLTNVPKLLQNNPYYIAMEPGKAVVARQISEMINSRFSGTNVFVVNQYAKPRRIISNTLDTLIDTSKIASYQKLTLKVNKWDPSKIFQDTLCKAQNVVIIPSTDEAFSTTAISGIKGVDTIAHIDSIYNDGQDTAKTLHDIQEDVTVVGLQEWLDYGSLDGAVMEQFRMHIVSDYQVNYQFLPTANMVREYRRTFHTEPDEYAIKAFDFTFLLGKLMATYGTYFQRFWRDQTFKGNHTSFRFNQERGQRGWQNYYMQLMKFLGYELKPLKTRQQR